MNALFIASVAVVSVIILGVLFGVVIAGFSKVVVKEESARDQEKKRYNANYTRGHEIPFDGDLDEQMKAARVIAAKKAAITPRGANVRIGKFGAEKQPTAFDGIENDPITAVKIAGIHTWAALQPGATNGRETAAAPIKPSAQEAPSALSADDLVPGKDYPFIEITDEMSPAEKRKARIANAKAKSAAVKALKESAAAPAPASPTAPTTTAKQAATTPVAAPASAVSEPVAGVDYEVIEITDDMDPAEIRKARIANAKAKSAAMKAFKEAGGAASVAAATAPVSETSAPQATPTSQRAAPAVSIPANIPQPDYIEISDDMDPADLRKARIHNAKAKSAYVKALKEAGIDPATVVD